MSGQNDVMFRPEDVGGMEEWWEGRTMVRLYLREMYSVVQEDVMNDKSNDVFSSEGEGRSVNHLWCLFRYFLTRHQ